MLKELGWASTRPVYLVGVCALFVVATVALFKSGILPQSSWSWATAGAAGPGVADFPASPSFQSALDASLRQSEARIEAKLEDLDRRLDHTATGSISSTSGGGAGSSDYPRSDISKLLASYPNGSKEYQELQRYRYCRSDGNYAPAEGSQLLTWQPEPGKFVFPLCEYGQISNRLGCLRWYMLLSTLLNRTLVMPQRESTPNGYMYNLVLDVEHVRQCIGGESNLTVITLQEYLELKGLWKDGKQVQKVVVDSIWCWRDVCLPANYERLFAGVITVPRAVAGNNYRSKVRSVEDLVRNFGALPDEMISFGNLYGINRFNGVPLEAYTNPNLPFAHQTCRLVVQPHLALILAAKGFVKTIIGARYMAVHLRRGDFHHFWGPYCERVAGKGAFSTSGCKILSMGAIANCILEKLEGTGINIVYIATNSQPTELGVLERILEANPRGGPPVTLIRAPPSLGKENYFWTNSWNQMRLDDVPLAHATLDKLLCAMAKIFMGSVGSTFTDDIITMRAGLGTLSCHDQAVCAVFAVSPQDELPSFNISFTDPYQGTRNYRRRK